MSPGIGSSASPKPPKGSLLLARRERRKTRVRDEEAIKQAVRVRDGYRCRVPGCTEQKHGVRLEIAHLDDKGMGGDPRLVRTAQHRLIALCFLHHQGPISLHSKDLRIEPETDRGTDGPCVFYVTDEQTKWRCIGVN